MCYVTHKSSTRIHTHTHTHTHTQIIEDLLELMYRCMFLVPVSHFQNNLKPSDQSTPTQGQTVVLPFLLDHTHEHGCTITVEGQCTLVEGSGVNGYTLGQLPLSSGKYTWKVSGALATYGYSPLIKSFTVRLLLSC